jgi:hypothetical protein
MEPMDRDREEEEEEEPYGGWCRDGTSIRARLEVKESGWHGMGFIRRIR